MSDIKEGDPFIYDHDGTKTYGVAQYVSELFIEGPSITVYGGRILLGEYRRTCNRQGCIKLIPEGSK